MSASTIDSRTATAVSALRTLSQQNDFLAFAVSYTAAITFQFPEHFKVKKYPGLLFCQIVRNSSGSQVQGWWKNRSFCDAHEPLLRAELSLGEPVWTGTVTGFETPHQPWWKRYSVSLGKFLLGMAALFGALSAVRDHFADLLAPPSVTVYISDPAPTDYAAGGRLTLPLKMLNLERFGQASVNLKGALLRLKAKPSVTFPLQFDTPGAPVLGPGQAVEAHLLGDAPPQQPGLDPQDYEMELDVRATGGFLWGSRSVAFQKRTLKIWSGLGWKPSLQASQNKQLAYVDVAVYSGRALPAGARGYVLLRLPEAPDRLDLLCCATVTRSINSSAAASGASHDYASKIEFRTGALQPFQKTVEQIVVAFKRDLTPAEWEVISKSLKVQMEENPS